MFGEAEVDDVLDIRDGEAGLGNVGGEDHLPDAGLALLEDATVLLPRQARVNRQNSQRFGRIRLKEIIYAHKMFKIPTGTLSCWLAALHYESSVPTLSTLSI